MSLPDAVDHKHVLARRGGEVLKRLQGVVSPIGVEVGVYRGALSACVLRERKDLMWFMVDPWSRPSPDSSYAKSGDSVSMLSDDEFEDVYRDARDRVSFAGCRAQIVRTDSVTQASMMGGTEPDIVFIDADHSDESVTADVKAWWPVVKRGGWLGGHDWRTPGKVNGYHVGPAVTAALESMGVEPDIELGVDRTWWIRRTP